MVRSLGVHVSGEFFCDQPEIFILNTQSLMFCLCNLIANNLITKSRGTYFLKGVVISER